MTRLEELQILIKALEDNNGDPRQLKQLCKELNELEYQEVEDEYQGRDNRL